MPEIQAGCFSGLLGSRRRRTVDLARDLRPEKSQLAFDAQGLPEELPKYARFANCCDFSCSSGKPPSYPQATPEGMFRPEVMKTIESKLDALDPELRELSLDIHDHPELMFEEKYAHDVLTAFMLSHGFSITKHYLGLETAWRAEFSHGKGGRVLGVNSEMDALPGLGHACGHNLIAIAGVGVALAVKAALETHNVPGTVILLGTPAEESGCGKQILLDRGGYKEMDVCVMCHPNSGQTQVIGVGSSFAMQFIDVEYYGQTAHASEAPWEGINALDAAFIAYSSISVLRQQIKPDNRIHGVISGKDWVPNAIPDYAKMTWIVRAPSLDELVALRGRVTKCFEAASLATGCKSKLAMGPVYDDLRQNIVLAKELASTAQHFYGIPTNFLAEGFGASTDFGNVTYACPAFHPSYSIPTESNTHNHTSGFAKASRTPAAHKATMLVTKGLAMTGFRVLDDGAFYNEVRQAYEEDMAKAR